MQHYKTILHRGLLITMSCLLFLCLGSTMIPAQSAGELRYLRIGSLHMFFGARATEPEYPRNSSSSGLRECDGYWWPAEYGDALSNFRAAAFNIGTTDFFDPVLKTTFPYKVVGVGPRDNPAQAAMSFTDQHRLVGKYPHPLVIVDGIPATEMDYEDLVDEFDENMIADRMIVTRVNTSIGVSMTRRIMAFAQQNHDNYFIFEYTIKNTGIIDAAGTVNAQPLTGVVLHLQHRYAPGGGEPVPGYDQGWGTWESTWGMSALNQVINTGPDLPTMQYTYYGPFSTRNVSDDWGCPNELEDGVLGGVQYIGFVNMYAEASPQDDSNDPYQPFTTYFLNSDDKEITNTYNQYDEEIMRAKYEFMTSGHAEMSHADQVEAQGVFPDEYAEAGGYSQCHGFGPYDMEPGDSIQVVFAEGVSGISRKMAREVGRNWLLWTNGEDTPTLIKPDGTETTDQDEYKREWVWTGEDSLIMTLNRAVELYKNGLDMPLPPPAPESFYVNSGGDRIQLTWADNAVSWPNFNGYVVYRSQGSVNQPETIYEKLFECDLSDVTHTFDDTTARRGFNYYYYVQSKDDGSQNDIQPGKPLYSSKFWTMTNVPAYLRRPAVEDSLEAIRIVPNPYDIRSRALQFGVDESFDRIAFYNLPPECTIRIFTERGDLIWEKDHTDFSGDELWDSKTSSGQLVVSGLYLVHFETPKGQAIIKKLIVIR